ncbi:hypothetical protein [[Mycobacterium] crassicus]|uniref:Uncharacterized protein n=1 Tax=[Mycobacterium] crassicus TaxID=2872309 RepID=A0ABU5XCT2_9MYCO|nr:hypothetical protein [Mycolicibacter sp. MYC098]MEB3020115.1 hypothetical protein [Mycolicibacter sp. MYC098]
MADVGSPGTGCAAQLSEVLDLLARARNLFGDMVVDPPGDIAPRADAAGQWVT